MKNILILGGGGYVGCNLVRKLLKQNHNIIVYDLLLYKEDVFEDLKTNKNLKIIKGDIRNLDLLETCLENINIIPNYFNGLKSNPKTLELILNDKQKSKLFENRKTALNRGLIVTHDSSWVKCKIKFNNDTLLGKLRLKGDGISHLNGEKWSFRIKLKGKERLFGMKKFSIQAPKTRNYIYEWIFHQALRRENIISLRYEFINVVINGENKGVFALEEHFDEHLLVNNHKENSVIVRFNEDYYWNFNDIIFHNIIYNFVV